MAGLWERFKLLMRRVGDFQARVVFSVLYFVLLLPFATGLRLFSDPLRRQRHYKSNWVPGKAWPEGRTDLRRQS
jgi:hypothetical protein